MQIETLNELCNESAERAVLSALMLDPHVLDDSALKGGDFYFLRHRYVYEAIGALREKNNPVDHISVGAELERLGHLTKVGGWSWLGELSCEMPSTQSVLHHAELVWEDAQLRAFQIMAKRVLVNTQNRISSEDLMQEIDRTIQDAYGSRGGAAWQTGQSCVQTTIEEMDKAYRGETSNGLSTGLKALDKRIGGLRRGNLIIFAARPGMGKTALATGVALSSLKAEACVGIISLEMSTAELIKRMLAMEGENLSVEGMDRGIISKEGWDSIVIASEHISSMNFYLCDEANVSVDRLRMKARSLKRQHGLDLLLIDYLQLLAVDRGTESRVVAMSEISRSLKVLAKELDIPIIALSQLNRACEGRPDKRPLLSDLRETGAIEQDADLVICIYRDEVYDEESPDCGTAELLIRKNRNGRIGEVRVGWQGQQARFVNLDH